MVDTEAIVTLSVLRFCIVGVRKSTYANSTLLMMTRHEEELLNCLKEDHKDAFSRLYQEYYGPLLLIAYQRLKDKGIAHQIVQDCFVEVWERKTYRSVHVCLKSLLCIMLLRKAGKYIEKTVNDRKKREKFFFSTPIESCELNRDLRGFLGDFYTSDDLHEIKCQKLMEAIRTLPPQQYATVQLVHFDQLTYEQAAQSMHVTVNTVKTHLRRAQVHLRDVLKRVRFNL